MVNTMMVRHRLRRRMRALAAIGVVVLTAACTGGAPLPRLPAVPARDVDRASVFGIPDARFLPNDAAAMSAIRERLYARENKYYASIGRPLPPEYLLAISGGGDNGAFGAGLLVG